MGVGCASVDAVSLLRVRAGPCTSPVMWQRVGLRFLMRQQQQRLHQLRMHTAQAMSHRSVVHPAGQLLIRLVMGVLQHHLACCSQSAVAAGSPAHASLVCVEVQGIRLVLGTSGFSAQSHVCQAQKGWVPPQYLPRPWQQRFSWEVALVLVPPSSHDNYA